MFAAMIDGFGTECTRAIARGESLTDDAAEAFSVLLLARELAGRPLLGAMAGPDGSIDTVTGRCGHPPARVRRTTTVASVAGPRE